MVTSQLSYRVLVAFVLVFCRVLADFCRVLAEFAPVPYPLFIWLFLALSGSLLALMQRFSLVKVLAYLCEGTASAPAPIRRRPYIWGRGS
ncbi:MAG: hypothetical protein V2I82_03320 [Halieaceae bacterium]|jgi:hypothetical protein|nr:hypothetical protein [Halieaceae bacterium]